MAEEHVNYGHRLEPHIADTARLCWDALDGGETVIFEGAQATLLDLDHGTYPFVTSSNPIAGAATSAPGSGRPTSTRSGESPRPTRPGSAPGPSRPSSTTRSAAQMLERGHEYGTTTGRERRCGWMDLVALRYAVRLNRMNALAITKLDVLSGIGPLRVAVRYRSQGGRRPRHASPTTSRSSTRPTPEYEELPGFDLGRNRTQRAAVPMSRNWARPCCVTCSGPVFTLGRSCGVT